MLSVGIETLPISLLQVRTMAVSKSGILGRLEAGNPSHSSGGIRWGFASSIGGTNRDVVLACILVFFCHTCFRPQQKINLAPKAKRL